MEFNSSLHRKILAIDPLTRDKAANFLMLIHLVYAHTDETKKRELLKNPTKIEEIQEKKFIDRN